MLTEVKIQSKSGKSINFGEVEKFIVINEEFEILDYRVVDVDCEEGLESSLIISINDLPESLRNINNAKNYYVEFEEQLKEVVFKGCN